MRWFVRPYFSAGWSALRAVNRTAGFLLRRLEQATGVSALAEISDFFTSMSGLFENFQARVERAYEVLRGAETAFVLVTGPGGAGARRRRVPVDARWPSCACR